jgi:hypothetical protein
MKKLITLALVLIMTIGLVLPVSAADTNTVLSDAQIEAAANSAAAALVAADDDATVKANNSLIKAVAENADTPEEIADFFSKFIFVEKSEVEAVSKRIADSCTYRVTTIEGGKKTVYVAVDLRTCKEIFDARVFLNATQKIFDKSKEKAITEGLDIKSDSVDLMSYNHLAGELALHMIITDFTNDMGASDENPLLKKWFDMSVVADLNVDEDRLAPAIIELFGKMVKAIMGIFAK